MSERDGDRRYYDSIYGGFAESLNAAIRVEAFGEEIGQNSWLTADEHRHFFTLMDLDATSEVLEVASGSGGPALFMAAETGCDVTGIDLHESGVAEANAASAERGLTERARFVVGDARESLPFPDASFDAELREIEGDEAFASLQEFLGAVHALASERRLSRLVYVARKP